MQSGFLWHYGHFIHDLLLPLNDWFITAGEDPARVQLYLQDTSDQSVGPFTGIVETFFQTTLTEVPPEQFEKIPGTTLTLKAYLFGPYPAHTFENMLATADARFGLEQPEVESPSVILIERGVARHGFERDKTLPEGIRRAGAQRRSIANHSDVAAFLSARYGNQFRNVVLEQVPFADQVRMFHGARLVLGQHGAGLNNILWMRPREGAVVEIGQGRVPTFINMCRGKGLRHVQLGNRGGHLLLDIDELTTALSILEDEDPHLRQLCSAP